MTAAKTPVFAENTIEVGECAKGASGLSLRRWNPKRDANEKPIVDALRGVGAHVTRVSGEGAPDLLVRHRGILYAWEVKSKSGKRTEAQEESQWPIVRTIEEALEAIGVADGD